MKSIVIPAYNEEDLIGLLHERLLPFLDPDDEIVFVNDGSSDSTADRVRALADRDGRVRLISFSRNFGHQPAVTAGLCAAGGDVVIVMDCDLQDPPELIPMMLRQHEAGFDVVHCVRRKRKETLLKRMAYDVFYRLYARLTDFQTQVHSGDFALMSRRVVDEIVGMPEKIKFIRGLRAYVGFRQTSIEYERPARAGGEPKYNLRKLIVLALDGLFSFSTFPLRLMGAMGLILFLTSLVMAGVAVAMKLLYQMAVGTTTTYVLIFFFGGLNLLCLGILGEYIGKIFHETKRRPRYIVESEYGGRRGGSG